MPDWQQVRSWLRSWQVSLCRTCPLTAAGRARRRRYAEPFEPSDYIEVERP